MKTPQTPYGACGVFIIRTLSKPLPPSFDQLVESGKKKGATGDALYEGIIASAQRTDEKVNAAFGIQKTP